MRVLKPGIVYFLLVFGTGFVLGTVRVLLVVPLIGDRAANLLEMPLMLIATVLGHGGSPGVSLNRPTTRDDWRSVALPWA